MNKKGQTWIAMVIAIALVAIVAMGGFYLFVAKPNTVVQNAVASSCENEPYLTVTTVDKLNSGTSVSSTTLSYILDEGSPTLGGNAPGPSKTLTSGSSGTKFNVGDSGKVLVAKANYINDIFDFEITSCGNNDLSTELYATDAPTLVVFNSAGVQVTDASAGGATNQSTFSTSKSMKLEITSSADGSTGVPTIVLDAKNKTQVDKIELVGGTSASYPKKAHTISGTNSVTGTYTIAPIIDSTKTYSIRITPASGETVDGTAVNVELYTGEDIVDVDGSFKENAIEDEDGTAKYEDNSDYDYLIT